MSNMNYYPVQALQDEDGHWYLIPNELVDEFKVLQKDDEFVENGDFSAIYDEYRTGGDLNNTQLYIGIPTEIITTP